MPCDTFKALVKKAEAIADEVESALEEANPETIAMLDEKQKNLLEEFKGAGPVPVDMIQEIQQLNKRTTGLIEKLSSRKKRAAKILKSMGNRKKILGAYGGNF